MAIFYLKMSELSEFLKIKFYRSASDFMNWADFYPLTIPTKKEISTNYKGQCLLLLLHIHSGHLWSGPRYSSFLRNLPTNIKVFLRGL